MTIKVTKNFASLRGKLPIIQQKYLQRAPPIIKELLLSSFKVGISPVKNGRWDVPYSESYQAAIRGLVTFRMIKGTRKLLAMPFPDPAIFGFGKTVSPVNLKLSGQLYNDLRVEPKGNAILVHFVGDSDRIANYHNKEGAGKKKAIRQIMPSESGQTFNEHITNKLNDILYSVVINVIKE